MGLMSPLLRAGTRQARRGIRAWHGSPYDFNRFEESMIGQGEGTTGYMGGWIDKIIRPQMYKPSYEGHGFYLADKRGVAENYTNTKLWIKDERGRSVPAKRRMYEVDIRAGHNKLINLSASFDQQSPHIQRVLLAEGVDPARLTKPKKQQIWRELWRIGAFNKSTAPAFSQRMRARGIAGVRYLDQYSEEAWRTGKVGKMGGAQTYNYVIYDPSKLTIRGKQKVWGVHPLLQSSLASTAILGGGVAIASANEIGKQEIKEGKREPPPLERKQRR